jgi:hypothetical protein
LRIKLQLKNSFFGWQEAGPESVFKGGVPSIDE